MELFGVLIVLFIIALFAEEKMERVTRRREEKIKNRRFRQWLKKEFFLLNFYFAASRLRVNGFGVEKR